MCKTCDFCKGCKYFDVDETVLGWMHYCGLGHFPEEMASKGEPCDDREEIEDGKV